MATVLHNLTDVELLRMARTSPLMDCPLFAEMADRFEVETEDNNFQELRFQQKAHIVTRGGAKRGGA
jgi:hypothetical protein